MNLAVRFQNPHPVEGHSSEWPSELVALGDGSELPSGEGWQLMTSAEYETYLSTHQRFSAEYVLEKKREKIMDAIDARTRDLIGLGFVFEGKAFSLSIQAQQNLQNIQLTLMVGSIGDIPYPTMDNQSYILARGQMPAFIETAFGTLNTRLLSGTELKFAVNAMTTEGQMDSFLDPRT